MSQPSRNADGADSEKGCLSIPPAPTKPAARDQREVSGIPIGSLDSDVLEPGAPGLHSAGQRPTSLVLALAIAALALALALGGAALERSRLQVTP